MTFALALVPLISCAVLIALLVRNDDADARFAAKHRVPVNARCWHTYSVPTSAGAYGHLTTPTSGRNPTAHAAGSPVAHAGRTSRLAGERPTARDVLDRDGVEARNASTHVNTSSAVSSAAAVRG